MISLEPLQTLLIVRLALSWMIFYDALTNYVIAVRDPEIRRPWAFIYFMAWGVVELLYRLYLVFIGELDPVGHSIVITFATLLQWAGNHQMKRVLKASEGRV